MATPDRPLAGEWALILGISSGFGEAVALELAALGMNIFGVHLDRKASLPNAERIARDIKTLGCETILWNVNAADAEKRKEVVEGRRVAVYTKVPIHVFLHSCGH